MPHSLQNSTASSLSTAPFRGKPSFPRLVPHPAPSSPKSRPACEETPPTSWLFQSRRHSRVCRMEPRLSFREGWALPRACLQFCARRRGSAPRALPGSRSGGPELRVGRALQTSDARRLPPTRPPPVWDSRGRAGWRAESGSVPGPRPRAAALVGGSGRAGWSDRSRAGSPHPRPAPLRAARALVHPSVRRSIGAAARPGRAAGWPGRGPGRLLLRRAYPQANPGQQAARGCAGRRPGG